MRVSRSAHAQSCGCKMADVLEAFENVICFRIRHGNTHEEVSRYLRNMFISVHSLSTRSVRRLFWSQSIHYKSNSSDSSLDEIVLLCVSRVSRIYSRRSLHGLLRSEGGCVSRQRLGRYLSHTFPLVTSHRSHNNESSTLLCTFL